MKQLDFEIPPAFVPLLHPCRYKVLFGGRASTKSWTIARTLLVAGAERKLRILCAREIQNSIKDSVYSLLEQQTEQLGLASRYNVLNTEIRGSNGTEIIFSGLKHKIDSIKSMESIDICWVEEAHLVSKSSWDKLTPTIRKPGSEIWISFNPELETDETYKRFVVSPPEGAWVQKVSYKDNPWFSEEMRGEMKTTRLRSEDDYLNIWLGHTKQALEGAVYARELREAAEEGRICRVPYDLAHPVSTYWDFGHHDLTAIWFIQKVGFEYHVIDYYENRQQLLPHYVGILQERRYNYGTDFMPHDANSHQGIGSTIAERFKELTGRIPQVMPRDSIINGIDALRTIFPQMYFDQDKCADGLNALRHYAYKVDPDTNHFSREPEHNWASHAADSLRTFSVSNRTPRAKIHLELVPPAQKRPKLNLTHPARAGHAWMTR